ncbi:MAG: glycosyltransferase family 4 protein [Fibrobacterales bacterium]
MPKPVLLFAYDYPPLEGGISRLCVAVVEELKARGSDIEVLTIERSVDGGFAIPEITETRLPPARPKLEWAAFNILKKYAKTKTVVTDLWYPEGLLALLAGVKDLVVIAHGNDIMKGTPTLKNRVLTLLRNRVLKKARVVICNSHYTEREVKKSVPKANTQVVPLGVDADKFIPLENKDGLCEKHGLPQDKKLVFTMSRLQGYKAHDTVLKAIAAVPKEKRTALHYVIAGRGPYESELKKLAVELGLESQITWLGFVNEEDIVELYNAMDLFALCTREEKMEKEVEGFGLVFLEAQACAVPCVGSTDGGIPDAVIIEQGGWLIEPNDSTTLALILERLIDKPEQFIEEGLKGRKRVVAEATWKHFGEAVSNIVLQK